MPVFNVVSQCGRFMLRCLLDWKDNFLGLSIFGVLVPILLTAITIKANLKRRYYDGYKPTCKDYWGELKMVTRNAFTDHKVKTGIIAALILLAPSIVVGVWKDHSGLVASR